MPPDETRPVDPKDILTSRRIGAAISALADPNRGPADPTFHLDEAERDSIRQAVQRSTHPLAAFAHGLLDQWEQLADEDRVPDLLFAEIVNSPGRDRSLDTGRGTGRGVER
jgi:hypothetical protein